MDEQERYEHGVGPEPSLEVPGRAWEEIAELKQAAAEGRIPRRRLGRGSLRGLLRTSADWDSPAVNDEITRSFDGQL